MVETENYVALRLHSNVRRQPACAGPGEGGREIGRGRGEGGGRERERERERDEV